MATKKTPTPATAPTKARPKSTPRPKKAASPLVGELAPDFSLVGDDGKAVTRERLAGRRVVLFFYPKDDTPGCTREACAFQDASKAFAAKDVVVLGVSRDGADSHQRFRAKYGLSFPLLTDADAAVHKAFGAWGKKTLYGKTSEGVIRTTVLLDEAGVVTRVFSPVQVDGHADAVLEALG